MHVGKVRDSKEISVKRRKRKVSSCVRNERLADSIEVFFCFVLFFISKHCRRSISNTVHYGI